MDAIPDRLLEFDCEVGPDWNDGSDWKAVVQICATALTNLMPELDNPNLSVSILFTCDNEVRQLNREWRGKDTATNVLSFPMLVRDELLALGDAGPPVLLGDIALAAQTCAREAAERAIRLEDHAAHLIVHGLLHLAGYDHETSPVDAEAMEALETKALALIGIADPYGDDHQATGT